MKNKLKLNPSAVSKDQNTNRQQMVELFEHNPLPGEELMRNLSLFQNPADVKRMLFMNELYEQQLDKHGVIMELGVRWGQNLSLFQSFRAIYEPFNYNRKIIGFDTWEGFPSVHKKDGKAENTVVGGFNVTKNYEVYLEKVLGNLEKESALPHMRKFELVKGDAIVGLEKYLKANPQTIISLAYFDFDIYEPTARCLEMIKPHLTKGSIIGFDELNYETFPGETLAVKEVFGLSKYKIQRSKYSHLQSYIVYE